MEQDQELLDRCLAGEDSAWEALLRGHTRKIYNLCYRFTGRVEEAEDLTQEVFIKVFQTLKTYQAAQGSFTTWLNRVARNHLVDHYRRARKDRVTSSLEDELPEAEQKPSQHMEPTSQVESRERREALQLALDKLSPDLRSGDPARPARPRLRGNRPGPEGSSGHGEIENQSRKIGTRTRS